MENRKKALLESPSARPKEVQELGRGVSWALLNTRLVGIGKRGFLFCMFYLSSVVFDLKIKKKEPLPLAGLCLFPTNFSGAMIICHKEHSLHC